MYSCSPHLSLALCSCSGKAFHNLQNKEVKSAGHDSDNITYRLVSLRRKGHVVLSRGDRSSRCNWYQKKWGRAHVKRCLLSEFKNIMVSVEIETVQWNVTNTFFKLFVWPHFWFLVKISTSGLLHVRSDFHYFILLHLIKNSRIVWIQVQDISLASGKEYSKSSTADKIHLSKQTM